VLVWLAFFIGRINIGQGAYALMGGCVSAILVELWRVLLVHTSACRLFLCRSKHLDWLPNPALAWCVFCHGDAGATEVARLLALRCRSRRRQRHDQHSASGRFQFLEQSFRILLGCRAPGSPSIFWPQQ
jgi:hypothetical protein